MLGEEWVEGISTIGIAGQGADLECIVFGEETDYGTTLIALLLDYIFLLSLPVAPVTAIIGLVDISQKDSTVKTFFVS